MSFTLRRQVIETKTGEIDLRFWIAEEAMLLHACRLRSRKAETLGETSPDAGECTVKFDVDEIELLIFH